MFRMHRAGRNEAVSKSPGTCADGLSSPSGSRVGTDELSSGKFFRFSYLRQVNDLSPRNSQKSPSHDFVGKLSFATASLTRRRRALGGMVINRRRASKVPLECGSLLPPWFGEACFASEFGQFCSRQQAAVAKGASKLAHSKPQRHV
jgi:hypothetical protein